MAERLTDGVIIKARKRVALRIAEAIELQWPNLNMEGYDVDEAAKLVEGFVPLTSAEADAELRLMLKDRTTHPTKPSVFVELREAIGMPTGSIGDVIRRAVSIIRAAPPKGAPNDEQ